MGIFFWIMLIIVILYGGSTLVAGFTQLKQDRINTLPSMMMIAGGILIILAAVIKPALAGLGLIALILGLLLIHISAVNNGMKMYGKINIKHHAVRLLISIVLIILYSVK